MAKYHISADGKKRPCRAKGNCPLGVSFDGPKQANQHIEKRMSIDEVFKKKVESGENFTREEAIERGKYMEEMTNSLYKNGKTSDVLNSEEKAIDGEVTRVYTKERKKIHDEVIQNFKSRFKNAKKDGKVVFSAGLPGAGKTTILTEHSGVNLDDYVAVSSDDFKEEFAERGLTETFDNIGNLEVSTLSHEETSMLADRFLREMSADGYNIIYDYTAKSVESTEKRIDTLKGNGYKEKDMQFVFVDIPLETARERTIRRYEDGLNKMVKGENVVGGRYLPDFVLDASASKTGKYSSVNAEVVIEMHRRLENAGLPKPKIYDNSGDREKNLDARPFEIDFDEFKSRAD